MTANRGRDMLDNPTSAFRRAATVACLALATLSGCLKPPAPTPADPATGGRVVLTVNNNYRADVTVYVVSDGQPTRVGLATSSTTASFDIPARLLGQGRQVRLRADPIGVRAVYTSELIRVGAGQRIEWTLETDLNRSSIAVY